MAGLKRFTDLVVWQKGHKLVLGVYKVTDKFPKKEKFGLIDQLRRAVVSLTSNIAEGFGRQGNKEKLQFYYLARSSLIEVQNQLLISRDIGYLDLREFKKLADLSVEVHKLINSLIKKTRE